MNQVRKISRRNFVTNTALAAGGLLIPFFVTASAKRAGIMGPAPDSNLYSPNAYLQIGTDNSINVILSHVEMGQGVGTTLSMLIAEELDCDWKAIKIQHAPPGQAYVHTAYGMQMTGGSSTTWSEFDRYRNAGAAARILLVEAAAKQAGVSPADCHTENSVVIAGDKKFTYGQLAEEAAKLSPPATIPLRAPKDWKYIGKAGIKRVDTADKINGTAKFGIDTRFPGLLIAVVAHAPVYGAKVKAFDAIKAKAIAGVRQVVQVPTGVAVLADHFWAAKTGRDALKITWDYTTSKAVDSKLQLEEYRKLAATKGASALQTGDVAATATGATHTMEAEYFLPYLAHAAMEPLNCTVKITPGKCEIWTGTQMPTGDQAAAAAILGLKPEQVEINTPYLGGGFGRRANKNADFVTEAVHIAKVSGKAVKMIWTREDDMRAAYYRPAFLHKISVGLNAANEPVSWKQVVVGQSIMAGSPMAAMIRNGIDDSSVEGVVDSPYVKGLKANLVELHTPDLDLPVLWWRSVGHSHTGFVMESMIDELAHNAGKDPVEYRKALLKDSPRHLSALNLAAEKSGWGTAAPAGHFRGVAVHESFGSTVAHVAEVSVVDGQVKVHKFTCAIDCGLAVNPDGVKAQMESCIIYGLTAALHGEITLEKGKVVQSNFHDYQVVRMSEAPKIEVYIVDSTEKMGGSGEPGVPPVAPALTNAIFAATGRRIRQLPVKLEQA